MIRNLHLTLVMGLILFLSACASSPEGPVTEGTGSNNTGDTSTGLGDELNPYGLGLGLTRGDYEALGIHGNPLDYRTIYFEYNSTAIDRKSEVISRAHAANIAANGIAQVTLEGNADERGTRDYNLALGERRAIAVANLMISSGANSAQFRNISYGEERPVDPAHNEAAWAKNRRVQIVY